MTVRDRDLTFDEAQRRLASGNWLYTREFGWLDRRDGELMTLWSLYCSLQAEARQVEDAENAAFQRDLEHAAALAGMTPQGYLERLLADRGAKKLAEAEWLALHPDAKRAAKRGIERRAYPLAVMETKASGNQGRFNGYLAVFGNSDAYNDVIKAGAFTKTLTDAKAARVARGNAGDLFPLLWQHKHEEPIGGILDAREDSKGLYIRAYVDTDTELGQRAYSGMTKGYLTGLSIGFIAVKATYKGDIRQLMELKLIEGSLVSLPANDKARVSPALDF